MLSRKKADKMARTSRQLYFVMQLADADPQRSSGYEFGIQILDARGRAKSVGYLGSSEKELTVESHVIPQQVIEAAMRQQKGQGDYVNRNGESVHPITGASR
jgi:hypothetical protein